ncbi:MAG: hypothetical protein CME06_04595 [Gemmatimonadetes bacterium]|nr:hypothetical protein [Gemmatimonadota bacterium]
MISVSHADVVSGFLMMVGFVVSLVDAGLNGGNIGRHIDSPRLGRRCVQSAKGNAKYARGAN